MSNLNSLNDLDILMFCNEFLFRFPVDHFMSYEEEIYESKGLKMQLVRLGFKGIKTSEVEDVICCIKSTSNPQSLWETIFISNNGVTSVNHGQKKMILCLVMSKLLKNNKIFPGWEDIDLFLKEYSSLSCVKYAEVKFLIETIYRLIKIEARNIPKIN